MLVLSRKRGESLLLGDDVEIEVVRVQGNRVTLGVKAPKSVKVVRKEIYSGSTTDTKNPAEHSDGGGSTIFDGNDSTIPLEIGRSAEYRQRLPKGSDGPAAA